MAKLTIPDKSTGDSLYAEEVDQIVESVNALYDTVETLSLEGGSVVTDSTQNGSIVVNGVEMQVYDDSGKADTNHTHDYSASFAPIDHSHAEYSAVEHTHSEYAASSHNHDTSYAAIDHTHDYAATNHTHTGMVVSTGSPTEITTLWAGSQAEYDAIAVKDSSTLYHIV